MSQTLLGQQAGNDGNVSGTTKTVTVTGFFPAGSYFYVATCDLVATVINSVQLPQSPAVTFGGDRAVTNTARLQTWSTVSTQDLTNPVITITYASAVAGSAYRCMVFSGVFSPVTFSDSSNANVTTNALTCGNVLLLPGDILVCSWSLSGPGGDSLTPGSGYLSDPTTNGTSTVSEATIYMTNTPPGANEPSATKGGTGRTGCGVVTEYLRSSAFTYIPSLGRRPVPMIKGPDRDMLMTLS